MKSPFKFLDSFTKEDREIFFGREKEIEELYRRTFRGKIMLVYGVSGTGKSSLINCGLANKFRDEDWLPLNIRRGKNMLDSLYAAIVGASLTPKSDYTASEVQFKKNVKSLYLDYYKPIYFIFDQFEELFIFGSKEEKSLFVRVIKTLVDSDILCHFIFVMREEYMASVTEFEKHIPVFFSNRVRIENMDHDNARQAILGPCKVFNISVEEGFPEALIENLSPGSPDIELTYLQVFLDKILRLAVEEQTDKKLVAPEVSFTIAQLQKIGNVSDLLGTFLNEQISLLDDPDSALAVLKSFVSVKGTKRQMTLDEVKEYAQTLGKPIKESVLLEMLQNFVNLRILRDKDQHDRYELRHDSLATRIYEKISVVEKDILEIRQFIEDGWHNWQKRGILLSASDLDYIAPYESRLFLSIDLLNLINQSKNQLEKVKRKRRVIFVAATFILLILFAGFTIWALIERSKSIKLEIIANASYFNATSKEMAATDPTKALRLANHAYTLNPDLVNYQNLVTIYSSNDFYYPIFIDKKYLFPEYKIINNNALAIKYQKRFFDYANCVIELYSTDEKLINKWEINQEPYYWDISSDQKSVLTISPDSIINIYDQYGNLTTHKKIDVKEDVYPMSMGFLPNSRNAVLFLMSNSETSGVLYLFSGDGKSETRKDLNFEKDTYLADFYFDKEFFYLFFKNGVLNKISYDGKNKTRTKINLVQNEFVNSVKLLDDEIIAVSTSDKKLYVCNWKGQIIKSLTSLTDNINFIKLIKHKNLFIGLTKTGIQILDFAGNNLKTLHIKGIDDPKYDYDSVNNRIIFSYNEKLYAWDIGDMGNNLIFESKKGHRTYPSNHFIVDIVKDTVSLYSQYGSKIKTVHIPFKNATWDIFPSFNYILVHNINNPDSLALIIDLKANIISSLRGLDNRLFITAISENDSIFLSTIGPQRLYFGLWTIDGKQKKTFIGHNAQIRRLEISDDYKKVLSGDLTGNIILWDTSGRQLQNFKGHTARITSLDISHDGSLLLTGAIDGTAKLWNTNGQLLYTFQSPEKEVPILAKFSSGDNSFYVHNGKNLRFFNRQCVLLQTFDINSEDFNVGISEDKRFLYFPDKLGIKKIRVKQPIDTFLTLNKFADLTIPEKLDLGYSDYENLIRTGETDQLAAGAKYFGEKSMIVITSKEKSDFQNKAESLYRTLVKLDTTGRRYSIYLTNFLLEKSNSSSENVKLEIDNIYETILAQKNYEDLFAAGSFYRAFTNSSTTKYDFAEKAITIFNKILSLYPEKKKALDSPVGSLAWQLVYLKQFKDALDACLLAKRINPDGFYANINLPPCYLLVDSVEKAKGLYLELKNRPVPPSEIQNNEKVFGDVFKSDLNDLKYRGFQIKDYEEILKLLKSDTLKIN